MGEEDVIAASLSWCFQLKANNDQAISLGITCPINFLFDVLHVILTDLSDSSSSHLFIKPDQDELTPLLKCNLKQTKLNVQVYGIKTICTQSRPFGQVVCCGDNKADLMEDLSKINVRLMEPQDEPLPLVNQTQGTLPADVFRQPPSFYRLDVDNIFATSQDFIIFVKIKNELRCFFITNKRLSLPFPFELPTASKISCKIICTSRQQRIPGSHTITSTTSHSKIIVFKTFLSLMDNHKLFRMAVAFDARKGIPGFKCVQYFYRNKSFEYYNVIMQQLNGEMRRYLKSNGGEQGSVLNGRLPGLFFSTLLDSNTNKPSTQSHYGPMRLYVQSQFMFNPHCNLYFGDFYCHFKRHHVTIILTTKSSPCNRFCQQYLLPLNIFSNPYLHIWMAENGGSFVVFANMNVTVDIFYTETINVLWVLRRNMGYFEETKTVGRGYAPPSGIPKNVSCEICNLP